MNILKNNTVIGWLHKVDLQTTFCLDCCPQYPSHFMELTVGSVSGVEPCTQCQRVFRNGKWNDIRDLIANQLKDFPWGRMSDEFLRDISQFMKKRGFDAFYTLKETEQ